MRCAVLLRGINVSGHRKVSMKELVAVCEEIGVSDVESYLQSGNLVFDTGRKKPSTVSAALETAIEKAFDYDDVDVLLRTGKELAEIVAGNPHLADDADPKTLHVTLLKDAPESSPADDGAHAPDGYRAAGQDIYVICPNGYGRTKLNNQFFERKFGVRATTRNWRTITTLADMTS